MGFAYLFFVSANATSSTAQLFSALGAIFLGMAVSPLAIYPGNAVVNALLPHSQWHKEAGYQAIRLMFTILFIPLGAGLCGMAAFGPYAQYLAFKEGTVYNNIVTSSDVQLSNPAAVSFKKGAYLGKLGKYRIDGGVDSDSYDIRARPFLMPTNKKTSCFFAVAYAEWSTPSVPLSCGCSVCGGLVADMSMTSGYKRAARATGITLCKNTMFLTLACDFKAMNNQRLADCNLWLKGSFLGMLAVQLVLAIVHVVASGVLSKPCIAGSEEEAPLRQGW